MNPLVAEIVDRLSEDHRELWEERAAIIQYDAGYSRDYAECLALLALICSGVIGSVPMSGWMRNVSICPRPRTARAERCISMPKPKKL